MPPQPATRRNGGANNGISTASSSSSLSPRTPAFARAHPLLYESLLLIIQTTPLFITLTILSTRRALRVPRWQSILLYYGGVAGFLGRYVLFIATIWWTLIGW
ncbi:hypothetical protein DV736_g4767, partial [Chaetothyriales sp. CBS 134916]